MKWHASISPLLTAVSSVPELTSPIICAASRNTARSLHSSSIVVDRVDRISGDFMYFSASLM